MEGHSLYLITAGAIIVAILVIICSVKLYGKKKKALEAKEVEMKNRLFLMEKEAQERIKDAEDDLSKRNAEFKERVDKFNKEQKIRESLENKTDREVVVEMHVKASNILDSLESIDNKIVGVKDYSEQLKAFEASMKSSIYSLETSLRDSVSTLEGELRSAFSDMDSTIEKAISSNINTIDESDIREAVCDALNYDSYSFMSTLEETVNRSIDSKFSELDYRLSDIESKLDN